MLCHVLRCLLSLTILLCAKSTVADKSNRKRNLRFETSNNTGAISTRLVSKSLARLAEEVQCLAVQTRENAKARNFERHSSGFL